MKNITLQIEGLTLTVTLFDEVDLRLEEACHRGKPLVADYTYLHHRAQPPQTRDHVHLYRRNQQLFAVNDLGRGHDGYHGYRMPARVADALRARFPYWNLPADNILESVERVHFLIEIAR